MPPEPDSSPLDHEALVALAMLGPVEGRCTAWVRKQARHCLRFPILGGTVCPMHGGRAPQVRAAAARRRSEDRSERIAARLGVPVAVDPHAALLGALHSAWGAVLFWQSVVADLELKDSDSGGIIGRNHLDDQALHVATGALAAAEERVAKFAKACLDAGFSERQVRVAEQQANTLAAVLRLALADLGHDIASPDVARVIAARLRELQPAIEIPAPKEHP